MKETQSQRGFVITYFNYSEGFAIRYFKYLKWFAIRWMIGHKLRSVLAITAIAGGAAIALSVLVALSSISWSFNNFSNKLIPGAQLKVVGPIQRGGIEPRVLTSVLSTKGVESASAVVEALTNLYVASKRIPVVAIGIGGPNERVQSSGITQNPSLISISASPDLASQIVDCNSLAGKAGPNNNPATGPNNNPATSPSNNPATSLAGRSQSTTLMASEIGLVKVRCANPLPILSKFDSGNVVLMGLGVSEGVFARHGKFDDIYIKVSRSANLHNVESRLARVVGPQNSVVSSGTPPPEAQVAINSILPLLALLSLFATVVSVVLVNDILVLSFAERRKQLAIVYALGTPSSLGVIFVMEPILLGVCGGLIGSGIASYVGAAIIRSLNHFVQPLSGTVIELHLPFFYLLLAPVIGGVLALLTTIGPVRKIGRRSLSQELSPQKGTYEQPPRASRLRLLIFAVFTTVGMLSCVSASLHGALYSWQFPVGIAGFVVVCGASILMVGGFGPVIARASAKLVKDSRLIKSRWLAALKLALTNLANSPGRTATMTGALATCVAVAFIATSYDQSIAKSITGSINRREAHWVYLSMNKPASISIDSEQRFTPTLLHKISKLPDVAKVVSQVGVLSGSSSASIIGVETSSDLSITGIKVIEGSSRPALIARGQALVGTALARRQHLRAGKMLVLDTPHGLARLRVAGIWENGDFNGESAFISEGELEKLYGYQPPTNIYVYPKSNVTPAKLASAIKQAKLSANLMVSSESQAIADELSAASGQLKPFWTVQRALIGLAFLSVLTTLVLSVAQRSKEIALLACMGFSPGMIFGTIVLEALMVSIVGTVLAFVLGVIILESLFSITPLVLGYFDPFVIAPLSILEYGLAIVILSCIASILPARRANNFNFAQALRDE